MPKYMIRTALFALALSTSSAMSDGLAGSYLAATQASQQSDYEAAARYYVLALARDPGNPGLMENAVASFLALGNFKSARPIAMKLQADGFESAVANLVTVSEDILAGDFDVVVSRLNEGAELGPIVGELSLAWALLGQGDVEASMTAFDEIIAEPGTQSFGLFHKALALASVGNFDGAVDIFMGGNDGGPVDHSRISLLAHVQSLSQLERNDDAVALLTELLGQDITDPEFMGIIADLEAGKTLPFTVAPTPQAGLSEAFYTLASALQREAAPEYTLLYSRVAEQLNPNNIEAILLSANLLEDLQRYELAVQTYARVPETHPSFHVAEMGRADALVRSEKHDAAIEVLNQLAKKRPDLAAVHTDIGDIQRNLENYADAALAYDKAIALYETPQPSQWYVYYARAVAYERQDIWENAEANFRMALELFPDQPQVLNYLGYSLVEKQIKLDEALEMIERAVELRPDDGYITDSLAWVLYRLGRYDEAIVHMQRAAELEPVDPIVSDHLGDVLWAVGRKTEAVFQWRRAQSFEPEEKDAIRIRRKLEVGLDVVLEEEGAEPLTVAQED